MPSKETILQQNRLGADMGSVDLPEMEKICILPNLIHLDKFSVTGGVRVGRMRR